MRGVVDDSDLMELTGLSGPAIRPVAVRCVWQVRQALPDVPILGMGGMPRRVAGYMNYPTFAHFQPMNEFISMCAFGLGISQIWHSPVGDDPAGFVARLCDEVVPRLSAI